MNAAAWTPALRAQLVAWLDGTLGLDGACALLPADDPLRVWWSPDPAPNALRRLVDLLVDGQDHLTLAALIERSRGASALPPPLQAALAAALAQAAAAARRDGPHEPGRDSEESFLAYAHEDTERALAIGRMLRAQGLTLFRDVERIRPGESITTRLQQALARVSSAVLIVSRHSLASTWVAREIAQLLERRERSAVLLLPVLIDDVDLPDELADIFTIDLRGYAGAQDDAWARPRLQALVQRLGGAPNPLPQGVEETP